MEFKKGENQRGFSYIEFNDRYGQKCSIQKSSLATEDAIWFGIDDADPKIRCHDAIQMGIREKHNDERDNGWCEYKIPDDVLLHTRMHLNREQVKELLPILLRFAETGEI